RYCSNSAPIALEKGAYRLDEDIGGNKEREEISLLDRGIFVPPENEPKISGQNLTKVISSLSVAKKFSPVHTSTLQAKLYKAGKTRIEATVDGDTDVPTLTPLQAVHVSKSGKQKVAAIVGGVCAALIVVVTVVIVYICLMHIKRFIRRASETESSVPSLPVDLERGNTSAAAAALPSNGMLNLRQLTMTELKHATSNFSQSNLIGEGGFGFVYKGLLQDGSIVAIKRCFHTRTVNIQELKRIASVHHKHLVKLVGYCAEHNQQLLVYDYLPNGNVGKYLYDDGGLPIGKLDIQQRLLIALGAAKGLEHLHSYVPPFLHLHFRTTNVLVDDAYTAKVSDFGLPRLLDEDNHAGTSSSMDCFLDPEIQTLGEFSERSDVFSYGVFLLELMSGHQALGGNISEPWRNLVFQAKETKHIGSFIDRTLGDRSKHAAEQMMELALQCVDTGTTRPTMRGVVEELEQIWNREIGGLHSETGEDIGVVTLGSELFK
ncbi:Serine-threonine/tyrosine-protein kinase, catalytic domain, partial [Dillenia turbinata]